MVGESSSLPKALVIITIVSQASSLYNGLEEDTPPIYQRTPDEQNRETG